jgi:hypothetical protein
MRSRLGVTVLLGLLFATPSHAAVSKVGGGYRFAYTDASASSVALAGSFNDWSTTANPMSDEDKDGTWTTVIDLKPGSYEYKFVVNDGTWVADPDNPRTGGDFDNSLLDVNPTGTIAQGQGAVIPSGTPVISNNPLNSKVYLGGFFRFVMPADDNSVGDARLRLRRPQDQFNFDVTANLSEKLWASTRLQIKTDREGANELPMDLYKAQGNFIDDKWAIQAYYNEEAYTSDDLFRLIGYRDLRGTIAVEERPFGQGTQGLVFTTKPWSTDLSILYSDTYDEDIFNPDLPTHLSPTKVGLNQSTGTDVLGVRWTKDIRSSRVGATYRGILSDWWVNFTKDSNLPLPPELEEYNANQIRSRESDKSDNFELSNDFHTFTGDVEGKLGGLDLGAGGGYTWYESRWAVGNHEKMRGTSWIDGKVDIPIGNQGGYLGKALVGWESTNFTAKVTHEYRFADGMDPGENSAAYWTHPGLMMSPMDEFAVTDIVSTYQDVNGSDAVDVMRMTSRPELNGNLTELDLGLHVRDVSLEFELDRRHDRLGYSSFWGDGAPADLRRAGWRTSPRLIWRPFSTGEHYFALETELLTFDDSKALDEAAANKPYRQALEGEDKTGLRTPIHGYGHLIRMDSAEIILRGLVPMGNLRGRTLSFEFNLRWMDYDGPSGLTDYHTGEPLDLSGTYFDPWAALVWKPADPVRVLLGFGVDPTFYDVITPEGWPNGRQAFRDDYLLEQGRDPYHPVNILEAEQVLEDRTQIVINAFVKF